MIGFTFNGTHSGSVGCWMLSTDRTVRPEKRVYTYSIPGRSGTIKLEDGTWEDRLIRLRISFTGASLTRESLRQKVRSVAGWLSGSGDLSFDDEPGVYYKATVQGGISLEQVSVTGSCEVGFLCDPFAYAAAGSSVQAQGAAIPDSGSVSVVCTSQGTAEADCTIRVKALSAISTLSVKRGSMGRDLTEGVTTESGVIGDDGTLSASGSTVRTGLIPVSGMTSVTVRVTQPQISSSWYLRVHTYNAAGVWVAMALKQTINRDPQTADFDVSLSGAAYIRLSYRAGSTIDVGVYDTSRIGSSTGWVTFSELPMAANSVLTIDTENLTADLDGANALHLLSDTGDLSRLRLQPGGNIFAFKGTAATADITIEWRDRWL